MLRHAATACAHACSFASLRLSHQVHPISKTEQPAQYIRPFFCATATLLLFSWLFSPSVRARPPSLFSFRCPLAFYNTLHRLKRSSGSFHGLAVLLFVLGIPLFSLLSELGLAWHIL